MSNKTKEKTKDQSVPSREHVLSRPEVVYSEFGVGVLPAGTTLVHNASFPEGIERFLLYVNVEKRIPTTVPSKGVSPLSILPEVAPSAPQTSTEELVSLLISLRVTPQQLQEVVQAYPTPPKADR